MSTAVDNSSNLEILTYLQKIDKKISNLEYDLNDLKERVYKDEASAMSAFPWGNFTGVDQRQLDIDEQNFDKAWILKHYKVDCPEFDQPLSIESLHNMCCDMTPEEYGKYIAAFNAEDDQKVEAI